MGTDSRRALVTSVVLVAVLLACANASAAVAGPQSTPEIRSVAFEGDGVLDAGGNVTALWNNGSYALTVTVGPRDGPYELCSRGIDGRSVSCRSVRPDNATTTMTVTAFPWTPNETGREAVEVTLGIAASGAIHDSVVREVRLLDPAADLDDDGLVNRAEVRRGTNMTVKDTDRDGLEDGEEVHVYGTDPRDTDTDGDGIPDAVEIADPDMNATDPAVPADATPGDSDGDLDATPGDSDGDPDAPPGDSDGDLVGVLADLAPTLVALLLFAAVVVGGVTLVRDRGDEPDGATGGAAPTNGDDPPSGTDDPSPAGSTAPEQEPILTDEERVLRMLHEHDGQVKQGRIVAETEWSKSKVSRLLSRMADEGAIRKITIGRENVIRLAGEDDDDQSRSDSLRRDRS